MKKNGEVSREEGTDIETGEVAAAVQRETKEVLAELVEKIEGKAGAEGDAGEPRRSGSTT